MEAVAAVAVGSLLVRPLRLLAAEARQVAQRLFTVNAVGPVGVAARPALRVRPANIAMLVSSSIPGRS